MVLACIYGMVIVSWSDYVILTFGQQVFQVIYLVGLPPKLELLAVFSSSDTMAGMYTVGHVLL